MSSTRATAALQFTSKQTMKEKLDWTSGSKELKVPHEENQYRLQPNINAQQMQWDYHV